MDKLQGIKPGDRVRVTFEGVVSDQSEVVEGAWGVAIVGGDSETNAFTELDLASPHFQIERIEPPLKVGDRVKSKHDTGTIVAVVNGWAWLRGDTTSPPYTTFLCDLERIA